MTVAGTPHDDGDLHGRPTAQELLDAVLAFMRDQLAPQTDGPLRYQVRVAVRALEIVSREMKIGPDQAAAHSRRLSSLDVQSDGALARGIRDGSIPDSAALREVLSEDTRDRLLVANPNWLPSES